MSYEGYEQHICENGHYFIEPCSYMMFDDNVECYCGAKSAWINSVDDTNCDEVGYIPRELLMAASSSTFVIPTEAQAKKLRTYRNGDCRYFLETQEKVEYPEYTHPCTVQSGCYGLGDTVTQNPRNNPCTS